MILARDAVDRPPRRLVPVEPATLAVGLGVIALLAGFGLLPHLPGVRYPPLSDYLALGENSRWVRATANTCRMVVLSTLSATALGFVYAFALSRVARRSRAALRLIAMLPLFSPPFT